MLRGVLEPGDARQARGSLVFNHRVMKQPQRASSASPCVPAARGCFSCRVMKTVLYLNAGNLRLDVFTRERKRVFLISDHVWNLNCNVDKIRLFYF